MNSLKKRRGFTLVEILTAIILLGILAIIIVPVIENTLKKTGDKLYEGQISNIKSATKNWASKNPYELPENEGETITITLGQLQEEGFIDKNIKNPKNKEKFSSALKIIITKEKENFHYEVIDN